MQRGVSSSPTTPHSAFRTPQSAILLVALGASLWGTDTVLRRPLAGAVSSLPLVFYEHLVLSAILLPVCVATRDQWRRLRPAEWAALLGIAWGGSALGTLCFTQAVTLGNPTTAVLLQKLQPLFAVLLAAVLLGERLRRRHWFYLAVAMASVYLVSFGDRGLLLPFRLLPSPDGPAHGTAALFAVAAAMLWGASTVLGRYLAPRLSFAALTALRIVAALPLLLVLVVGRGPLQLPALDARQFASLLWLALVPGLAALLLYYRGLRSTPASLAAIAELCFPATATLLNWIFLDSRITALQVAGFLLLWGVIAQMERERRMGSLNH